MFVFGQWDWLSDKIGSLISKDKLFVFGQWDWLSDKIGSLI